MVTLTLALGEGGDGDDLTPHPPPSGTQLLNPSPTVGAPGLVGDLVASGRK